MPDRAEVERLFDDLEAGHSFPDAVVFPVPRMTAESVSEARSTVRDIIHQVLSPVQAHEVQLVTSELVTNAIVHGKPPVRLLLREGADDVIVAVFDRHTGHPCPGDSPASGLRIVADITLGRWGVKPTRDGKWVWAQIAQNPSS